MNAINKIVLVTAVCLWATIASAESSSASSPSSSAPSATPVSSSNAKDISGTYTCNGHDPFSSNPDFKETIIFKKIGDTYNVQMTHSGNMTPYDFGTGIVNKDAPNVISYVYWDPKNPNTMGTELLEIKADGSLAGVYADVKKDKAGTETCTKS